MAGHCGSRTGGALPDFVFPSIALSASWPLVWVHKHSSHGLFTPIYAKLLIWVHVALLLKFLSVYEDQLCHRGTQESPSLHPPERERPADCKGTFLVTTHCCWVCISASVASPAWVCQPVISCTKETIEKVLAVTGRLPGANLLPYCAAQIQADPPKELLPAPAYQGNFSSPVFLFWKNKKDMVFLCIPNGEKKEDSFKLANAVFLSVGQTQPSKA